MDYHDVIARNVKRLRKQRNLTPEELAKLAGCSRSMVRAIERGSKWPSVTRLIELAKPLGASPADLLSTGGGR